MEDITPFLPGSTIGLPVGALPPPGVYGSVAATHFDLQGHNGQGGQTTAHISSYPIAVLSILAVPDFKVLGASYGFGFLEPVRLQTLDTPTVHDTEFGAANTIVNVGTLSWALGGGFFSSVGANLYPIDGSYKLGRPVNLGRNYATFEPKFGMSYLKDGWNLTSNLLVDVNTTNQANNYHSGDLVAIDLTATKKFGNFEVGVGSDIIQQFTPDTLNGVQVTAIPNVRGQGNRAHYASVGPVVSYNFGPVVATVIYQQAVVARDYAAGNQLWARFQFPLWSKKPATATTIEEGATR